MSEELSLSEQLRRAREGRGETLDQVNKRTGISPKVLEALEEGDLEALEVVYLRLAVVHYGNYLGLDGHALAQEFACAREVFAEVDEALSLPLSRIAWDGPAEELTLTQNAQPALMATSMAALRVLAADYDPMQTVRELHALSAAEDQPIAAEELRRELEQTLPADHPVARAEIPEAVTRGDFCRLLFASTGSGAG